MVRPTYTVGLDLGQAADYSALAVVETVEVFDQEAKRMQPRHAVRHLHRWPLRTTYPAIVRDVKDMLSKDPLRDARLIADATGVGRAVVDVFREAAVAALKAVVLTSGHAATLGDDGSYHVPKKE